ncbi:MAG TPA: redox-sensing transcriptional repressor Rex [Thermoanaerobaculia bacterium]|nr:redox-sensing transcriptional repressor Rex [Thermoanaerobaculia bacterium]
MAERDRAEVVSEFTTERLSVYLRCLGWLESQGQTTISSHELASRFHLNSAQIRKDLANFGELGIRGVGYNVAKLKRHLITTLGLDHTRKIVIVGAGNLGMALADYRGFHGSGFSIAAMFDSDPARIGMSSRSGVPVLDRAELPRLARQIRIEIGVIAVPAEAAQQIYDLLVENRICAILNFAPARLRPRHAVKLRNVDLRINLEVLSFFLKSSEEQPHRRT